MIVGTYCIQGNIRPLFIYAPFAIICLRANLRMSDIISL